MENCHKPIYMSGFQSRVDYNAALLGLPNSLKKFHAESRQLDSIYGETCKPVHEHKFANGDIYVGSWRGSLPEGTGKYLWVDGCMYQGEWKKGKQSGKGKLSWSSGATYEGDFLAGCIQGVGTYTGVDGTTYKGDWFLNEKSGFGVKSYSNGDVYEGSWSKGLPEGAGRYVWKNGDMYDGEWKAGVKSGRGTLLWACGDKYDGEWLDGLEHGRGVYTWADTSTYTGTWKRGLKDGRGTFVPATIQCPSSFSVRQDSCEEENTTFQFARTSSVSDSEQRDPKDNKLSIDRFSAGSESSTSSNSGLEDCPSFERNWTLDESFDRFLILDDDAYVMKRQDTLSEINTWPEQETLAIPVIERHCVQGVLINEFVSTLKPLRPQPVGLMRETSKAGERIFKGHQSYELMLNLQLGIRYMVGKKNAEPIYSLSAADFGPKARVRMSFPRQGSQLTPPHQSTDFKCKDYCPAVFRQLRELFKIDTADYMLSICGDGGLRELSSPGKSRSVFYLSHNDRFLIKTLRKTEGKVLLGMLWNYYNHVRSNENTLITKFFGLHRIELVNGQKVRFVVMDNMFCTDLGIHRRFDLKGSSQGRSADKLEMDETTTLKDLDLNFAFQLESSLRQALVRQVECDCKFLESEHIMDYSLLLGLHFRAPSTASLAAETANPRFREGARLPFVEPSTAKSLLIVSHKPETPAASIVGSHVGGNPLRVGVASGNGGAQLVVPRTPRLGVNMPAKAVCKPSSKGKACASSKQDCTGEAHDVVLYFGIIDILQQYDMGKKLERAYKSLQYDSFSISAVDPGLYSMRFQNFIQQTFPEARTN